MSDLSGLLDEGNDWPGHTQAEQQLIGPFYEHAERGELALPQCPACSRYHWYPEPVCPHCRSAEWTWTVVPPTGKLFTWTVVNHAFSPELVDRLPFIVGLVAMDIDPIVRLITNLVCEEEELREDLPVVACFGNPVAGIRQLPLFAPRDGSRPL